MSFDIISHLDRLCLIWMSPSGRVLGHMERQSSESSESWSHIAKHWYCISVTGRGCSGGNFIHDSMLYGEIKSSNDWCVSEGVETLNWQSEYRFRSKASVTPPADESFRFYAKWSQFQACIWRRADQSSPLLLDQLEYGWMWGTLKKILTPVMLPTIVCHLQLTTSRRWSIVRVRTVDQPEARAYHMRYDVPSSAGAMA